MKHSSCALNHIYPSSWKGGSSSLLLSSLMTVLECYKCDLTALSFGIQSCVKILCKIRIYSIVSHGSLVILQPVISTKRNKDVKIIKLY